jgi:hypothetical protein
MKTAKARELGDGLAELYPISGNWHRVFPWTHSVSKRDSYQTTYYRAVRNRAGESVEHKMVVMVHRNVFPDASAATWDISQQLSRAVSVRRRQLNDRTRS